MHRPTTQEMFEVIEQAIAAWSDIVVPIFVDSEKTNQAANGLGSAYLCAEGDRKFLVTALHVVTDANKSKLQVANINGKGVDLGGLPFHVMESHDVAVAELREEWIQSKGITSIKAAPVGRNLFGWRRTGIYVAIGYPGTKNRLDMRYGKVDRYCHSISLKALNPCSINTPIQDALCFSYDHKKVINSAGEQLGPQPDLYGMSGGPCLELLSSEGPHPTYSFDPVGVLTEWHQKERAIVAAPLSAFFSRLSNEG